ncbi:sodium:solute symporter family transporter [Halegenticoccus tardaugens]|uniref:sodium:solute symporter family transporter n=1 Tax=Halegenticoccus tardaugens TaxID=2071624 RepID=UPI00100BA7F1|nr:sodium:proline symporter [Halegenticoccus tardaugens]
MVSTTLALGVTVLALGAFAAIGIWYSRGRVDSVEDFISARDSTGEGMTTATLVASAMGAWILFSPAEAGARFGGLAAILGYAVGSAVPMLVYAVLGPRIRRLIPEGHTLTEYAYARYGPTMYGYVLLVSVAYMFIFLAAEMTGIAGALSLVAGVPEWQTAALVGGFVLAYTAYGGLRASILTDTVQTLLILPLLAVGFGAAILSLGGTDGIYRTAVAANPDLLSLGFVPGLQFGLYVVVAILGAELLNQAWWQRIYAARDSSTLRRSFLLTAVTVVPMVLLAGLFGVAAAGLGLVGDPGDASIAFFLVVDEAFPGWTALAVVVLAVLLVTSTADTLFNALSSLITADLPRLLDDPDRGTLTAAARVLTAVVALAATVVGAQGYSVLAIFLTADLLASATFFPLLYGLYSERATERGVLLAALAGLAVGLAYFPTARPAIAALAGLPEPSFLYAFLGAALVSSGLTVLSARILGGRFDLGRLGREIRRLDAPSDGDLAGGDD